VLDESVDKRFIEKSATRRKRNNEAGFANIQNRVTKLEHAKRKIVAARFYEIPAEAVMSVVHIESEKNPML